MCTVHESLKKNYFNQLVIKIIHTCLSLSLISSLNISLKLTLSLRPLTLSTPISLRPTPPSASDPCRRSECLLVDVLACRPSSPTWLECLLVVGFFFFFPAMVCWWWWWWWWWMWLWPWLREKIGDLGFFFPTAMDCWWWWWWLWLWLMVEVIVVGAVDVFLDSGIYYFIVVVIIFYCDVYIILLCWKLK